MILKNGISISHARLWELDWEYEYDPEYDPVLKQQVAKKTSNNETVLSAGRLAGVATVAGLARML